MKKNYLYIIFFIFFLFLFQENVLAQDCEYEYVYSIDVSGKTFNQSFDKTKEKISLSISNNGEVSGKNISNWDSDSNGVSKVNSKQCPKYIGAVITCGFCNQMKDSNWQYYALEEQDWEKNDALKELASNNSHASSVLIFQNQTVDPEKPTLSCTYDEFDLLIDTTSKTATAKSTSNTLNIYNLYTVSGTLADEWFASDGSIGKCLPVTVCFDKVDRIDVVVHNYKTIYIDDLQVPSGKYDASDCKKTSYSGDKEEYRVDEKHYACTSYGNRLNKINTLYQQASSSEKEEKGKTFIKINQEIKTLETLCKAAFTTFTYESDCVQACTNVDSDIAEIKDKYGISEDESNNAKCGLTSRVLNWVMKIINWLRYIVPVLLIILSILDFIKAIAADNEDEVKKVTSKFTKRLIVAVIIFLLPLALEFLLGIFGIDVNNFCL